MKIYDMPTARNMVETVVLANGQFPVHAIPVSILHNAGYIVCCDGAINNLKKTGISPAAIVGDCDSLAPEDKNRYGNIIYNNPDQETNDLTKAIEFCAQKNKNKITILGATGKREDHTLGNISLLADYLDFTEVEMITDCGIFTPIKTPSLFRSFKGQQVSLFNICDAEVTTSHLKYPVQKRIFTNWWQGTLNESMGNEFSIETTGKIIVYRTFLQIDGK